MSITSKNEGFTLLEIIISLGISVSLLLVIIKINADIIGDYCNNSEESILEDNFDNAMLNLDNLINGYLVSDIKVENIRLPLNTMLIWKKIIIKLKAFI